jgi:GTP cyclohydrolase I
MRTLPAILETLRTKLEAERAHMKVEFPYFLEREAPVSKAKALMEYTSWFEGDLNGDSNDFVLGIRVPVMSLCPCSKEISDYGAHNQRGYLTIETRSFSNKDGSPKIIWLEELIGVAEASASSPVYPVLKRADERYVTMYSYDHPVFVEDMVRNVAVKLKDDSRVAWFKVNAVNHESIHEHSAFAEIEWTHGN